MTVVSMLLGKESCGPRPAVSAAWRGRRRSGGCPQARKAETPTGTLTEREIGGIFYVRIKNYLSCGR